MNKYDYVTLVMEKTYIEMEEEELEFCKKTEADFYLPRIKEMQNNGYTNIFICSCIHDLYLDYIIYDDHDLGIKAGMTYEEMWEGEELYNSDESFNYETDNPLRD